MEEFIKIICAENIMKVHYSQVYKNISAGEWFWNNQQIIIDERTAKALENLWKLNPTSDEILTNVLGHIRR